jgi:hypothetical protein
VRELSYVLIVVLIGAPGLHLLRNPVTRSLRSVLLIGVCLLLAFALASFEASRSLGRMLGSQQAGIVASTILLMAVVLLPMLFTNRWSRLAAAIPPADWDTHWTIWGLRNQLWNARVDGSQFKARAQEVRARLAALQLPHSEWQTAREALLEQIDVTERILAGELVERDEALRIRARSDAAWKHAIDAHRRFLR